MLERTGLKLDFSLEEALAKSENPPLLSEVLDAARQLTVEEGKKEGREESQAKIEESQAKIEELEGQVFIDSLTGVYNRKAWEDFKNHSDYARGDQVNMVVIDLNGLKDINDKRGHDTGDEYIKSTALYLTEVFSRNGDKVFRLNEGGDEFIIVSEFIKPENLDEFNSHIYSSFNHELLEKKGLDFAYGIAHTDPQQDISIGDTFKRAEASMYENKAEIKAANPDKYSR